MIYEQLCIYAEQSVQPFLIDDGHPRDIAHKVIEALTGNTPRRLFVNTVKERHNIGVIGDVKVGRQGLSEALDFHIVGVVRADGHRLIDHLRTRSDVDPRSQFPSPKGKNFQYEYLGLKPYEEIAV